jgi:hypothetical protein
MHNTRDNDINWLPCAVQSVQFLVVIVPYVFMQCMLKDLPKLWRRSICCLTVISSTCQLRWWRSLWERDVGRIIGELHIGSPSLSCNERHAYTFAMPGVHYVSVSPNKYCNRISLSQNCVILSMMNPLVPSKREIYRSLVSSLQPWESA